MTLALHAFSSYKVKKEYGEYIKIEYIDDEDYDISYGNWGYIYKVIQYGNLLMGTNINIPVYDYIEDARKADTKGLDLVSPKEFVTLCETSIAAINKLASGENPLIDEPSWYLYDTSIELSFAEQKEKLLNYADKLLKWAKKGLYFVEEKE